MILSQLLFENPEELWVSVEDQKLMIAFFNSFFLSILKASYSGDAFVSENKLSAIYLLGAICDHSIRCTTKKNIWRARVLPVDIYSIYTVYFSLLQIYLV